MSRIVYVVDDDDAVRSSLELLLGSQPDIVVRAYSSGEAFLADLETLEPGVALLDVQMPGRSGIDVLATIVKRRLRIVVIMVTGQGNIEMAVRAVKNGALDFIEKPYAHTTLIDTIKHGFEQLDRDSLVGDREADARARMARLSPREVEVMMGLIAGRPNKIIAFELDISPRTVEIYRANVMTKLNVRSLSEALRIAFCSGLVEI